MKASDILNSTDPDDMRNIVHRLKQGIDRVIIPPLAQTVNEAPTQYPSLPSTTTEAPDCCDRFMDVSPDGVWSWFMDPRAIYFNYKTYFGAIRSNGDVWINAYDHIKREMGTETVLHAALEKDDHDAPSILIRNSDKRILAFYTKHVQTPMYLRISTNPEDVSAFGAEVNLAAQIGKSEFTYSNVIQLTGETNEPIYLFSRDHVNSDQNRWFYSKSTDGGATWGAAVDVFTETNRSSYMKAIRNGDDRIDFFVSDGHPTYDTAVSVFHFYYQGGSYYKTDGTLIGTSLPLSAADLTEIYNGTTNESWIWDIAIGADGHPVVVFAVFVGSSSDHRYYYGRWDGSAWVTGQITAAGGGLYGGEPYYSGGISLDHENPAIVYLSKHVSAQWEIFRYKTDDHGATWMSVALTEDSTSKNMRPIPVEDHNDELVMIWLQGTYTSYTQYATTVQGMGAWENITPVSVATGSLVDAPSDGQTYGRKDGAWEPVSTSTGYAEIVMEDGVTFPPVPITTEDGSDWIYDA